MSENAVEDKLLEKLGVESSDDDPLLGIFGFLCLLTTNTITEMTITMNEIPKNKIAATIIIQIILESSVVVKHSSNALFISDVELH